MQTNWSKWDRRFLGLARHHATFSKDPSTKVGCVIADHRNRIIGTGFNGFSAGIKDTPGRLNDRETKLKLTIHAERNALAFATRDVEGCTAYVWPIPPCSPCASALAQEYIGRVVAPDLTQEHIRWKADRDLSFEVYKEAGIIVDIEQVDPYSIQLAEGDDPDIYVSLARVEQQFRKKGSEGIDSSHRLMTNRADQIRDLMTNWCL